LEADSNYIIFEKAYVSDAQAYFQEIIPLLNQFEKGVVEKSLYHDKVRECVLLVVKLDTAEMERIIDEFLTTKLPMEVNFYIYGARRNGSHSIDSKVAK